MPKKKQTLLSVGIGTAIVLVLFFVTDGDSNSRLFPLLWPGAFLAGGLRQGAHDPFGLFLYFGGNVVFYSILSFVIILVMSTPFTRRNSA